ncbi:hypothetical protein JCM11251_006367 [Rhodosporidiobolus azoricus]
MYNTPPPSPTSTFPFLPLEVQVHILRLSISPERQATRQARFAHLRNLSRVARGWRRPAQVELFSSVSYNLKGPGALESAVDAHLEAKWAVLEALAVQPRRMKVVIDDSDGPFREARGVPWRDYIVSHTTSVRDLRIEVDERTGSRTSADVTAFSPWFPASNLVRLSFVNVALRGWYQPNTFPSLRFLIFDVHQTGPYRTSSQQDFFLACPSLHALALGRQDYLTFQAIAAVPSTVKQVLTRSMRLRRGRAFAPPVNLGPLLPSYLPHTIDTFTLIPKHNDSDMSDVIAFLSSDPAPPVLTGIKQLVLAPVSVWSPLYNSRLGDVEQVIMLCEDKGIALRWQTEEEYKDWRIEEWMAEEDE